jgi:hypothetical protein
MANMPEEAKAMFVGPPKTPEEVQQRRSAWTDFIDRIKSDPNMPALLMKFGTSLMQPIAPGQTPVGHFGQALQGSVDYLQAQRLQEAQIQKLQAETPLTQAHTGLTQAQTASEAGVPGKIAAETGNIQAQTKRTTAETETINAERQGLTGKLHAEIDRMVKAGDLDQAQADLVREKAKVEPGLAAAQIALQKAHAYYFTHPEMHARAMESARMQSVEALAQAFVRGGDDSLTAQFKSDPNGALNKARVQAQAGQVGQFWQNQIEEREAQGTYQLYSDMYDQQARDGTIPKGVSKQKWMLNQMITANIPPTVQAKVYSLLGRGSTGNIPKGPTQGPSKSGAWSIQKE